MKCYELLLDAMAIEAKRGNVHVGDCSRTLRMILNAGFIPKEGMLHLVMDTCAWCSRRQRCTIAEAESLWEDLGHAGLRPSTRSYDSWMAVIAGAAACGHAGVEDGVRVLDRMAADGVPASAHTFASLMAVVAGAARHARAGPADGERILQRYTGTAPVGAGVPATLVVYNAFLAVLAGAASHGRASLEVSAAPGPGAP